MTDQPKRVTFEYKGAGLYRETDTLDGAAEGTYIDAEAFDKERRRVELYNKWLVEREHKIQRLEAELAAARKKIATWQSRIKHCYRCGGDWVDNGLQSDCACTILSKANADLLAAQKKSCAECRWCEAVGMCPENTSICKNPDSGLFQQRHDPNVWQSVRGVHCWQGGEKGEKQQQPKRNPNSGHGHVYPRPDGVRARCGGPGICPVCSIDAARKEKGDE